MTYDEMLAARTILTPMRRRPATRILLLAAGNDVGGPAKPGHDTRSGPVEALVS
jgi:hypothetical protein